MTRIALALLTTLTLTGASRAAAADDPPGELAPQQRKQLEAKWQEVRIAAVAALNARNLAAMVEKREDALAIARRLYGKQDHADLATSLAELGWAYRRRFRYVDAEPLCRAGLEMRRRIYAKEDHPDLARSINDLAYVVMELGDSRAALALYREGLDLRRRIHRNQDHEDVAQSINNLGYTLKARGELAQAASYYRAALEMMRRLSKGEDSNTLAVCANNVAAVLQDRGRYAEAEVLYREAVDMRRRIYAGRDSGPLAISLNNVGAVLKFQGKFAEAEKSYREAMDMRDRVYRGQDHPERSQSINNVAALLQAQGRYVDAEPLFRAALAMNRRLYPRQDRLVVAVALNNLASLLRDAGNAKEAEPHCREALTMFRRLYGQRDHADLARALNNLGTVLWDQGKHAAADPLFRDALAMYRSIAAECAAVQSEGEALTLTATYPHTRDSYLANAQAMKTDPRVVYEQVWASKAALTRLYEQRAIAARAAATDPELGALVSRLTDLRRHRANLLLAPRPIDPATRKQRDADLVQSAEAIARLDRELRPQLPAVARAERLARAAPNALQQVLPADVAVIDCLHWTRFAPPGQKAGQGLQHTDCYLAFVITHDKIAWIDLGDAEAIDSAITAWRAAITGRDAIAPELPRRVRDLLWAKLRPALGSAKRVYVCPDLALCRVPWGALPGEKAGTILLDDYAIAIIPHAAFLLDKLWLPDPITRRPTDVLAVGGVAYDGATPGPERVALNRGDPLILPGGRLGWPSLPGTAAELQGVRGAVRKKGFAVRTLDQESATTTAVLAALPTVRHAHLATHGFFADKAFRSVFHLDPKLFEMSRRGERIGAATLNPMVMSGLVLAGANHPDTPGRGIITGEALVDLDLSSLTLAVLSACDTGLGDVAAGEGAFGLQRAFHLAGTRDVIASLWKVPDRPTAALMAMFYRNLWDKELPPIDALRQAQLEINRHPERIAALANDFRGNFRVVPGTGKPLDEPPTPPGPDGKAHPRWWAAFTLSGPGR
jgi:CHAT domain-containing protein/tetratricopeptide (TPR) repeat protein